ncbi:unnamed protein product [Allacma fusca]|uniref:Uncharacterized protein n=1 Tax=Allacma fusca TaxID=39272 RepID=A0A8J2L8C3_9HEXA|nr:unnamed protein product [Allacma fusca]
MKEITDYDYFVVTFVKKQEVEAVPSKWIVDEEGKRFCYWSKYPDIEDIYAAARDSDSPNKKTWKKYTIRIMHGFALGTDPHASDNDQELDLDSMAPKSSKIFNISAETPSSNYGVSTTNHKLHLKALVVRNFAIARNNNDALTTSIEEMKTLICNMVTLPIEEFVNLDFELSQDLKFKQSMVAHLDLTGGKRLVERINSIIRKLMTDEVYAVRRSPVTATATDADIRKVVMTFLQHAADRIKYSSGSRSIRKVLVESDRP